MTLAACTGDEGSPDGTAITGQRPTTTSTTRERTSAAPSRAPARNAGAAVGGRVEVRDRGSRRTTSGDVPGYVEIAGTSVEADADSVLFAVRLAGHAPKRMQAGAALRVTCQVLMHGGDTVNLDAQATESGWTAAATAGEDDTLPVALHVGTREIEMEIDRDLVGLRPFRWLASIAWTKGTAYGFDAAPEEGYADFPT